MEDLNRIHKMVKEYSDKLNFKVTGLSLIIECDGSGQLVESPYRIEDTTHCEFNNLKELYNFLTQELKRLSLKAS